MAEERKTVTVHRFEVYDLGREDWIAFPRKRTKEQIEVRGGRIIDGTEEEVDAALAEDDNTPPL